MGSSQSSLAGSSRDTSPTDDVDNGVRSELINGGGDRDVEAGGGSQWITFGIGGLQGLSYAPEPKLRSQ